LLLEVIAAATQNPEAPQVSYSSQQHSQQLHQWLSLAPYSSEASKGSSYNASAFTLDELITHSTTKCKRYLVSRQFKYGCKRSTHTHTHTHTHTQREREREREERANANGSICRLDCNLGALSLLQRFATLYQNLSCVDHVLQPFIRHLEALRDTPNIEASIVV
jgi:hypothetical protein